MDELSNRIRIISDTIGEQISEAEQLRASDGGFGDLETALDEMLPILRDAWAEMDYYLKHHYFLDDGLVVTKRQQQHSEAFRRRPASSPHVDSTRPLRVWQIARAVIIAVIVVAAAVVVAAVATK